MSVLTAHQLEQGLLRRESDLMEACGRLEDAGHEAALAEYEHEKAFLTAYHAAEGSDAYREKVAKRDALEALLARRRADVLFRVARSKVFALQAGLSAAQTIASAHRAEIQLAKTGGQT